MPSFTDRLQHAWNAFKGRDPTSKDYRPEVYQDYSFTSSRRPDRPIISRANAKTILPSIFCRLAVDASQIPVKHVRLDEDGNYQEDMNSNLNYALTMRANVDQTGKEFIRDAIMSMYDEGHVVLVPVVMDEKPDNENHTFEVYELRTGRVVEWHARTVLIDVYNEDTGNHEQIAMPKEEVAIVENPFYAIMNEPNSTLQQLIRTLNKLEKSNEMLSSNKLDMLIQLPYPTRSKIKQDQAEERIKTIETQLNGSKFGIAYIDVSEKVIPLNRSLENNLWAQVDSLTTKLYNELGLTQSIFDGTADEQTMLNYYNRSIEPTLTALCEAMKIKFLTKTAITQHQSIEFYREPFKLVPLQQLADIVDKFTRNEIMTGNEMRGKIGLRPSKDPTANELRNKNLNRADNEIPGQEVQEVPEAEESSANNSSDDQSPPDLQELLNRN